MNASKRCLTKADLADMLYSELDIDKQKAAVLVDAYIELIKDSIATDGRVMLSGFGSYEVNSKKARRGRNPQTGDALILRARKIVKFKPSQVLRRALNGEAHDGSDQED
jgi:integration host factor subunit alpha